MADNVNQLYGDYSPDVVPGMTVTPRQGFSKLSDSVSYAAGCDSPDCTSYDSSAIQKATVNTQLLIVCLGTGLFISFMASVYDFIYLFNFKV